MALGSRGRGVNEFNDPRGIAVYAAGRIYIGDTGNHRVIRIDDMTGTGWTIGAPDVVQSGLIRPTLAPVHGLDGTRGHGKEVRHQREGFLRWPYRPSDDNPSLYGRRHKHSITPIIKGSESFTGSVWERTRDGRNF